MKDEDEKWKAKGGEHGRGEEDRERKDKTKGMKRRIEETIYRKLIEENR